MSSLEKLEAQSEREILGKALSEATPLIINGWKTDTIYSQEAMADWREKACKIADSILASLTSAGYTIERGWCDDMSLAEIPSPSPLMGKANGVQFLMTWSPGSARLNAAFKDAFGQQAKESPDHPPGWYAWAKGLRCYTLDGKPIQVHPTHWRPITQPNGGE